jgi:AcrR family transcriptional regulator
MAGDRAGPPPHDIAPEASADWHRRVVDRSLRSAAVRSVDRGRNLIRAAVVVLDRTNGEDITVQDVADEAGQSLRTLYQYFESKDDLLLAVFEEAMRAYAAMIRDAIAELDDPLERLAGAIVAAVRMPEVSGSGLDRGLARLRLELSETRPELVGLAQAAMRSLIRELVEAAAAAGRIRVVDPDAASYVLLSLNAAYITTATLGNDVGVRRPDVEDVTSFCLYGLGAELDAGWFEAIGSRVRLPAERPDGPIGAAAGPSGRTSPRRSATPRKRPAR